MDTTALMLPLQLVARLVTSQTDWTNLSHPCLSLAFHYECNNESDKQEFEKALETIAVSFSST